MSTALSEDSLWPYFGPLWKDIQSIGQKHVLIAGGYGLFLKQTYLLSNQDVLVVVPFERWPDTRPRVTKDLDIVLGLDLIVDAEPNKQLSQTLRNHSFQVSAENPRWQFERQVLGSQKVIVELHAELPSDPQQNLKVKDFRVKHKPSLGDHGIHGRTTPGAVGCELYPFLFEIDGVPVSVPNPVTWSIMKLDAANNHWRKSNDSNRTEEQRQLNRVQAIKHAKDLCRDVAMSTRDEIDTAPMIVDAIRPSPAYTRAITIFDTLFTDIQLRATMADGWIEDDFALIQSTLDAWLK